MKIYVKKERETTKAKGGEWGNCRWVMIALVLFARRKNRIVGFGNLQI